MLENPWVPDRIKAGLTVKQAEFLCYEGREALFGGAAGGGKSVAILLAALQFVDEPGYSALILRRTYAQLAKSDSILDKSREWLTGTAAHWGGGKMWTFPSGATIEFGHMQHGNSIYNYQGGRWAYVGVDEATQFTEEMLAYPRTRQRRAVGCRVPIRWRGASNPGGIGHAYIKDRYIKTTDGRDPSHPDRQFFPAKLEDNPNIDREDYVTQLKEAGVSPHVLAQLLDGDWDAVPGGRFMPEWFPRFERHSSGWRFYDDQGNWTYLDQFRTIFQTVDPAASEKTTADFTVISTWGVTPKKNDLVWLDCVRVQRQIPDLPPLILEQFRKWKPAFCAIERVAANAAVYQHCQRLPMVVKPLDPMGQDKLVRATPAMNLAASRRVWLPLRALWLDDVESEVFRYTGDEEQDAHDDVVDTLAYAVQCLMSLESQTTKAAPYVVQ